MILLPIGVNWGAVLTSFTMIKMVSKSLKTGDPLSVTRTVTE
jgi:hypothetical protein